ncbi:MAG: hypothetical protein DI556_05930 [Rhodovulum sulfidophilum]|uniref:Response regulatory domain-containing protein n=1 Tax=Rhodovulum sulfidophilum TaxID=35806 RepID=A0A2W5QJN2_RHOSU|nr:MAG: hypothetical protein DI556_05930 [Rhodovulum sulfidophilum]
MPRAKPDKPLVLVVEDEPLLRMDAVDMVESAGFAALEAADADAALEILRTRSDIAILLTDIDMPGSMDGIKLARLVRDRWPPIEIIIVSGFRAVSEAEMPARGLFFGKPLPRREVAEALRSLSA